MPLICGRQLKMTSSPLLTTSAEASPAISTFAQFTAAGKTQLFIAKKLFQAFQHCTILFYREQQNNEL